MAWATTAWRHHLGDEHVLLDRSLLRPAQRATYPTKGKIVVVLRPGSANDVANCLRIAAAHEVPIKPISGGARWGYGSRVPSAPFAALLDLSRMQRIVDFDRELGTLTVQPGVSFAMAQQELVGSGWVLPAPGSTPYASVLGNTVDGGVCEGVDPLRRRAVLGLQAVLPSGEFVDTGHRLLGGSDLRAGDLGFDASALFLQGNLGVVTELTLSLTRQPPHHASIQLGLRDEARLPALLDGLRSLSADGLLRGSFTLYDAVRALSLTQRYPFAEVAGVTPLPDDWLRSQREALGGHRWFGEAALSGVTPEHLDAGLRAAKARLGPLCDALVLSPGGAVAHFTHGLRTTLLSAYWRKRSLPDAPDRHPDRDGVGLLWYGPVLPLRGERIAAVTAALREVVAAHDFESSVSLRALDSRTAVLLFAVHFDRDEDDERGLACFEALRARGTSLGLAPHRPGERGLDAQLPVAAGTAAFAKKLKRWVDPSDILAPGEGDLRPFWPED